MKHYMETQPTVISYSTPSKAADTPSPVVAMVLCLPGTICSCVLLGIWLMPRWLRPNFSFLRLLPSGSLMWCWAAAVICGLISLASYIRRPKPWYVCINLAVNITGLLFTAGVIALVVVVLVTQPKWLD